MNEEEIIEYIKQHLAIIIKYEDGIWCNANISLIDGVVVVTPDYDIPFDN